MIRRVIIVIERLANNKKMSNNPENVVIDNVDDGLRKGMREV